MYRTAGGRYILEVVRPLWFQLSLGSSGKAGKNTDHPVPVPVCVVQCVLLCSVLWCVVFSPVIDHRGRASRWGRHVRTLDMCF